MELLNVLLGCCVVSLVVSQECSAPVVNVYTGSGQEGETPSGDAGCCQSLGSKLDDLSTRLANIESSLTELTYSDWVIVFRAHSSIADTINLLGLWSGSETLNEDRPEAKQVNNSSFAAPYKSPLVEQWGALNIKKVKFAFYEDGVEVMTLIFNGFGSNKLNWFDRDRLLQTPYPDMLTSDSFNYFAIGPVGDCPACRMWYISKSHDGCPNDIGWVVVNSHNACAWDRDHGRPPRFLYSSTDGAIVWEDNPVASASVMAIYIQTGV